MNTVHKIPLIEQMQTLDENEQRLSDQQLSKRINKLNQIIHQQCLIQNQPFICSQCQYCILFRQRNWKKGMIQAMMNMVFILNAGNNTGGNPSATYTSALIGGLINGFFSGSIILYLKLGSLQDSIIIQYNNLDMKQFLLQKQRLDYKQIQFEMVSFNGFYANYVIEGYYFGLLFLIANSNIDYVFGLSNMHSNNGFQLDHDIFEMNQEFYRRGCLYYLGTSIFIFFILYFGWKINKDLPLIVLVCLTGLTVGILYSTEKFLKNVYGDVSLKQSFIENGGPPFQPDMRALIFLFVYAMKMKYYITIQNLLCAKAAEYFSVVKFDYDKEIFYVSLTNICARINFQHPTCLLTIQILQNCLIYPSQRQQF
ncbi:unnamed protein product [Paramecium pentaurelia]|uniref:Transmembrane protein n=1 Tax=Paramecium pentaurelia TaxID=43138 RepID=A0A8S1YL48_9CILI|nr:unnamed protein product [Paramecium pentaurelia]